MKRLWNQRGFTVVELIVTMAVLAILGATVSGLVRTGLSAYGRVSETHNTETEARAALSLVTTQLRKHDATGAITVDSDKKTLRLRGDPVADGKGAVIWFDGGTVYTAQTDTVNITPATADATAIAHVYDIEIDTGETKNTLGLSYRVTVTYGEAGGKTLSQTVTQRSAAGLPTGTPAP